MRRLRRPDPAAWRPCRSLSGIDRRLRKSTVENEEHQRCERPPSRQFSANERSDPGLPVAPASWRPAGASPLLAARQFRGIRRYCRSEVALARYRLVLLPKPGLESPALYHPYSLRRTLIPLFLE